MRSKEREKGTVRIVLTVEAKEELAVERREKRKAQRPRGAGGKKAAPSNVLISGA